MDERNEASLRQPAMIPAGPMPLDMSAFAPGLELREPGVWFARSQSPVSYPDHGNAACYSVEGSSFWFRHRNRCIVSVVRRLSPGGLFLDVGGGNGYVARGLIESGVQCALIEPGVDGALAAHARGVRPVICATLEDAGLKPGSVGAAGLFDVLEHIEDESGVLRRVHALLVAGGRLFLTVPAYAFLFSSDDVAAGHYRRYTASSLARALKRSGYRIDFATYLFWPLPPAIWLRRTLPSRLGFRRWADPEREASEHAPGGAAERLLRIALDREYRRIEAGKSMPFGGSCLCVASKAA
jgi:SAM-dependent methyltransferase